MIVRDIVSLIDDPASKGFATPGMVAVAVTGHERYTTPRQARGPSLSSFTGLSRGPVATGVLAYVRNFGASVPLPVTRTRLVMTVVERARPK